jgi:hypothetical protein
VHTFFRVIRRITPVRRDFLSNTAKRRPLPPNNPEAARLWDAVSVYDTEAAARRQARRTPGMGAFIAELRIPATVPVGWEKTLRDRHHYSLWGDADTLLNIVLRVTPVEEGGTP